MKVAWVGHSQVPKQCRQIYGQNLILGRVSGAILEDAYYPPISDIIESSPDITFVWLGGNDLDNGAEPKYVAEELIKLANHISQYSNVIYLCNLESRNYSNHIRATNYQRKARATNRLLAKKKTEILVIVTSTSRTINS